VTAESNTLTLPPRALYALRASVIVVVLAMILDLPLGPSRRLAPWVALDVSASWELEGDSAFAHARATADSLLGAGADSLLLFGDSVRGGGLPSVGSDQRSDLAALVDVARAAGRAVHVVTDGRVDGAARASELPEGSVIHRISGTALAEAGIVAFDAPLAALAGDTIALTITRRAGSAGAPAGALSVKLGARDIARSVTRALDAFGEEVLQLSVVVPSAGGALPLIAALDSADAVAANDTAIRVIDVRAEPSAILVSTAPDQDARFALDVLHGTRRGAIRGYFRVAPGQWRVAADLRPVEEANVRRAIREAGLVLLHGDTSYFGAPRAATRGALILAPTITDGEEWYAAPGAASPISVAAAALPWDSLPPLRVAPAPSRGGITALAARRPGRAAQRDALVIEEGSRRIAIVRATGFGRWRTRGGRSSDAFDALWGSLFDWAGAVRRAESSFDGETRIARELVPSLPELAAGPVGSGAVRNLAPRARSAWWLAALAIAALCVEWVMRRRIGWR
jgi:hypothetical protein